MSENVFLIPFPPIPDGLFPFPIPGLTYVILIPFHSHWLFPFPPIPDGLFPFPIPGLTYVILIPFYSHWLFPFPPITDGFSHSQFQV